MQITLTWRQVLLIAFGSWSNVAEAAGFAAPTGPAKWAHGVPSQCLDRLLAHPTRPAWLTREMLTHGAVATIEGAAAAALAAE